ncbi:hypothetical protein GLOTRDRAFT_135354 [Gloeophyllum trabeum ATCC 11539]|uniref:Uncharacterized protein n=1 Tax=Gloeophyllum trabeum (strain ATCC 11539 / FP-39264 / Madison 617) TaxID=670483 RepID=S7S054_GLOTA|nr:uncharacterized protein GLOTRDRAFT_135354 [Gloeophyllum trabeum ATCC 11539]EPQ60720.1 hypothetical protein GLOTRDRAFT_135354 [Gloeophyllum trabeum ATCC 11539]
MSEHATTSAAGQIPVEPKGSYPTRYLELVFKGRRRTEELLKPELENGNLTPHDYEQSTRFLGAPTQTGFGLSGTLLPYVVGPFAARLPAFRNLRLVPVKVSTVAFFTGILGYGVGEAYRIRSHIRFAKSLENPAGFERAVENVFHRIDGMPQVKVRLPVEHRNRSDWGVGAKEDDPVGLGMEPGKEVEEGFMVERMEDADQPSTGTQYPATLPSISTDAQPRQSSQAESDSSRSTSKWDQIRAANAGQGSQSAWEALRRRSLPPSNPSSSQGTPGTRIPSGSNVQVLVIDEDQDPERVVEQKRFDEMLEAERRRAAGQEPPKGRWT